MSREFTAVSRTAQGQGRRSAAPSATASQVSSGQPLLRFQPRKAYSLGSVRSLSVLSNVAPTVFTYYLPMIVVICFVLPAVLPWWLWNEALWNAFVVCSLTRYCFTLNMTWLVNSAAHMWGNRPYDKHISPRQNLVTIVGAHGEGFHNYHHTFPYDYRTSELGCSINTTTWFIDFFAWLGQVYDRKEVPTSVVQRRMERTGDGTRGLTAGTRSY